MITETIPIIAILYLLFTAYNLYILYKAGFDGDVNKLKHTVNVSTTYLTVTIVILLFGMRSNLVIATMIAIAIIQGKFISNIQSITKKDSLDDHDKKLIKLVFFTTIIMCIIVCLFMYNKHTIRRQKRETIEARLFGFFENKRKRASARQAEEENLWRQVKISYENNQRQNQIEIAQRQKQIKEQSDKVNNCTIKCEGDPKKQHCLKNCLRPPPPLPPRPLPPPPPLPPRPLPPPPPLPPRPLPLPPPLPPRPLPLPPKRSPPLYQRRPPPVPPRKIQT